MANNKNYLIAENSSSFPDNIDRLITPAILRNFNNDVIISMYDDISGSFAATISGSIFPDTNALESFTQSANVRLNNLEGATASYAISSSVAAVDAAQQAQINSIISVTSSYVTEAESGSFLVTASFDNGSRNLTFTKGNASTFVVNIPDVSGSTLPSGVVSGSSQIILQSTTGNLSGSRIDGAVSTATFASYANDIYVNAKNTSGAIITKGQVVRITGASGDNPEIGLADWTNDNYSANTLGVAAADIPVNGFADVIVQGKMIGLNTAAFTPGQLVYLGASGSIVASVPAPYHEVRLGQVLRSQTNNGSIYLLIDNGYELTELHDVNIVTSSLANNNLLAYDSASLNWINKTITEVGAATTGSNTFNGNQTINANLVANKVSVYDFDSIYYGSQLGGTTANGTFFGYGSTDYSFILGAYSGLFDSELKINADNTGITFGDFNGTAYPSFLKLLPNTGANPKPIMTRGLEVTGSTNIAELTASLQQGYVWVGDVNGRTTTVPTSSFGGGTIVGYATTGSNTFNGNQTINGALSASADIYGQTLRIPDSVYGGNIRFLTGSTEYFNIQLIPNDGDMAFSRNGAANTKVMTLGGKPGGFTTFQNNAVQFQGTVGSVQFDAPVVINSGINSSVQITGSLTITPSSVSTNAGYPIPFLSSNTFAKDSVDTLMYNPNTNQLYVSASTGQSIISPNAINFTSGSGQYGTYASTISKTGYTNVIEGGNYIGMMANPSKSGAPSLASSTKPAIVALSGSGVPYAALEFQASGSGLFTDGTMVAKRPFVAEGGLVVSSSLAVGTAGAATIGAGTTLYLNGTSDVSMATPAFSIRNTGGDVSFRLFRGTGGTQKAWWTNITNTGASGSYIIQDAQNSKDYITLGGLSSNTTINTNTNINGVLNLASQTTLPAGTIGDLAVSGSSLYFYDGSWRKVSLV